MPARVPIMSLKNKTILITRRPGQSEEMADEIRRLGGEPVVMPMISIADPESWEPVDRCIARLELYDAIVFTSVNAADRFLGRCGERVEAIRNRTHMAVGEKTRRAVERFGLRTLPLPEEYSSAGLAASLGGGALGGKHLLIPRGDIAREDLPRLLRELGAEVESVTVYRTVRPESADENALRDRFRRGAIDAVTFASPSAVANFAGLLSAEDREAVRRHAIVAVIGPTTAEAARRAGFDVAVVARQATGVELVRAIDEYWSHA